MLFEPNRTQYDLSFRVLGVPVRINPWFWVVSAVMGWSAIEDGFEFVLVWIACVFVSVLIHELGHVMMGRLFGANDAYIVLYSFGGLAVGSNALANRWKRIAVLFAGPAAGFLFLALIAGILYFTSRDNLEVYLNILRYLVDLPRVPVPLPPMLTLEIIDDLVFINLFWGLINLLPVWPLDGGQVFRDFSTWISRDRGVRFSLGISMIVAALLAINALMAENGRPLLPFLWMAGGMYVAIMFGMLAIQSFMLLQQQAHKPWREDYPTPWDRDDRDNW